MAFSGSYTALTLVLLMPQLGATHSKVLGMKKCPEFSFVADNSIERSAEITRRLKTLVPEEKTDNREDETDGE